MVWMNATRPQRSLMKRMTTRGRPRASAIGFRSSGSLVMILLRRTSPVSRPTGEGPGRGLGHIGHHWLGNHRRMSRRHGGDRHPHREVWPPVVGIDGPHQVAHHQMARTGDGPPTSCARIAELLVIPPVADARVQRPSGGRRRRGRRKATWTNHRPSVDNSPVPRQVPPAPAIRPAPPKPLRQAGWPRPRQ